MPLYSKGSISYGKPSDELGRKFRFPTLVHIHSAFILRIACATLITSLQEKHRRTVADPEDKTKILNRIKENTITLKETNLSRALLVLAQ